MTIGKIAKIESMGMLDGPGIRTVVFTQGCILRCAYCHNPALLSLNGGKEYSPEQLLKVVMKFKPYYGTEGGVTVSGGEPLIQTQFLAEFFALCKENGISTCLDTSGVGYGNFSELLSATDYVLLDIKHTNETEFKRLTLVDKERTIPFWEALNASNAQVWVRQVIMPNYNDTQEYVNTLIPEIAKLKNVTKVEFLPYHVLAVESYKKLGMHYRLEGMPAMDAVKCKKLEIECIKLLQPHFPNLKQN